MPIARNCTGWRGNLSSIPGIANQPMAANYSPKMDDVAAAAGVARSTVSIALRGDPRIPAATRKRIVAVAQELGYRPNPLVAALMTTRRRQRPVGPKHTVLAFVTAHTPPDAWRHYASYRGMLEGAVERAAESGFLLEEFPLHFPGMTPARFVSMLRARGIHGLLLAPLPGRERRLNLDTSEFAVVGLGLSVSEPPIERVSNDHFQAIRLAFQRCRAAGRRRIGLVVSRETSERLEDRWLAGFVFEQQSIPTSERCQPLLPDRFDEIGDALPGWLEQERPDVVLFGNYEAKRPYRLPTGIGMVSLDVQEAIGPLTGIFQDDRRIGAIAVDQLVAKLQRGERGPEPPSSLHLVTGIWVPGETL